jgi:hypothetical protein
MCELFPEKDKAISERILREGMRFTNPSEEVLNTLDCFRALGIIQVEKKVSVRCSNEKDNDYLYRDDLDCPGEIFISSSEGEYYCPECGRPINDISSKEHFQKYAISLDPNGTETYVKNALNSLSNIKEIESTSRFVFNVITVNDKNLRVVIPPYSEIKYHYAGLFFAEPSLYIIPSPLQEPTMTVLEKRQYLGLVDLLSCSTEEIAERLELAAIPIEGRRFYSDLERKFDQMITRHKDHGWQYYEQEFIPALLRYISENPNLIQQYLEKLQRLIHTIFGEFIVPIGGSGSPDFIPINKFEFFNQVFRGESIGDAKCYVHSTLSYDDVSTINGHIDIDPKGAKSAIVFVAGNEISSTAWNFVSRLRQNSGYWKIMIIPKYLILELISELRAEQLLDM